MRDFLCKFMGTLVISAALFSLAPKAAADGIVILPNGTLTGLLDFNYGSYAPPGGVAPDEITVTVPLANQTLDLTTLVDDGTHLQQVVVEIFWPGTNSPEDTITLQNCFVTSLATNPNSGTETVGFVYAQEKIDYQAAPPPAAVPEPGTLGLVAVGLLALIGVARKAQ